MHEILYFSAKEYIALKNRTWGTIYTLQYIFHSIVLFQTLIIMNSF